MTSPPVLFGWQAFAIVVVLAPGIPSNAVGATNSNVVAFVVASRDATVAGHLATPGLTILSGQKMQVADGGAMVAIGDGGRIILGPGTHVSFQRKENETLAFLDRGSASFVQPKNSMVRFRVGNIALAPVRHGEAQAKFEIRITSTEMLVAAREGSVQVVGTGVPMEVLKGTAMRFVPYSYYGPPGAQIPAGQPAPQRPPRPPDSADQPPASPQPPTAVRGGINWQFVTVCTAVGGAVGSTPLLVSEVQSASPDKALGFIIPPAAIGAGLVCALTSEAPPPPPQVPGDPKAGEALFKKYGCGKCHTNPRSELEVTEREFDEDTGKTKEKIVKVKPPSLDRIAGRKPDDIKEKVTDGSKIMPSAKLTDQEMKDLIAYLKSLKK
jgi:mono/diheme cytochrome c family protein